MNVTIKPDEAVTVIGMKGSGKTVFLLHLIDRVRPRGRHRMVILDTKQVGDFKKYPKVTRLKDLHKAVEKFPVVVYAPEKGEATNPDYHEGFFAWCYDRWDTTVVVDELTSIVWGNDVPDSYKDITDRGRARHVSIWQGNQKPVFVPHAALSEADHFVCFDLMMETDRKKVSQIIGEKSMQRAGIPHRHGFWYYHRSLIEPVYVPGLSL
jgi:ABC-type dipeptide/oligopeptide/nickel transport system ATPase component